MCDDFPIVVRATTREFLSPSTLRIAEYNHRATGQRVYVIGCWPAQERREVSAGVHSVGLAAHPACSSVYRERHYRNVHSHARLARWQSTWAAVDVLTHEAVARHGVRACPIPRWLLLSKLLPPGAACCICC